MAMLCKRFWTKSTNEWFLACMNSWMCFQISCREKDFGQRVQLNGFSPVWILECTFRWSEFAKDIDKEYNWTVFLLYDFGQREQPNCFSCVWTLEWFLSCNRSLKDFSHEEQLNGFSSVWTIKWELSPDEELKDLSHNEQLNGFSPVCLLKCFFRVPDSEKDFGQRVQQ